MKRGLITVVICGVIVFAGVMVVLSAFGWQTVAARLGNVMQRVGGSLASQQSH